MSEPERHAERQDDVAAYALNALDAGEVDGLERHLAGCEACREWLRWLTPAVNVLPMSVDQLEPPSALRAKLVETVREEAPSRAEAKRARRPRWLAAPRPAIALGTMAAVAAGVTGYALRDTGDEGASSTVPVQRSAAAGSATGRLTRDGDSGTLVVSEMPPLQGRDVYEVWLREGNAAKPSGVFVLDRRHGATVAIPSGLDSASQVMVTREPPGGSPHPTSPPMLMARI